MLWDETELSFWMFSREEIPQDIQDRCPDPDGWGTPVARWTDQSCDIQNAFRDMQRMPRLFLSLGCDVENPFVLSPLVVINITICGDWAGSAYDNGGFPGTCADAVANPSNYDSTTFPRFILITAHLNFPRRRFDQGQ